MAKKTARNGAPCAESPTYEARTLDFNFAPFLVIWEVTRACDLACVHCRASAHPARDPEELSLQDATRLFSEIRSMGTRLLVLTGGDPLKREDIFDLIGAARAAGLTTSLSPSATPLLTPEALRRASEAGLSAVSLSLDGATPATHDAFRGVSGSFDLTLKMAAAVRETDLELRINTTVTLANLHEMPDIAAIVETSGARVWSVFFLVPTGRAQQSMQITAAQCETLMRWLYELSATASYRIKTTEAPHYRRVVLEEMAATTGRPVEEILLMTRSGRGRFVPGINDARGFAFISHHGEVFPSGFLPVAAGNVRQTSLAVLYRFSVLFRDLRDPALLKGRCGRCAYREICGGSRARAWAVTGDPLDDDPLCAYQPPEAAYDGGHGAPERGAA